LFAFLIICNFFFHHISKKLISLIFGIPSGAGNPKSHFCNEMGTLTLKSYLSKSNYHFELCNLKMFIKILFLQWNVGGVSAVMLQVVGHQ